MDGLSIKKEKFHGEWSYSVRQKQQTVKLFRRAA
jgi:hypothetical protein